MPLNAGGYDSLSGPRFSSSVGGSEAVPLLIPEPEPEACHEWRPLTRQQLEVEASGPGWRRFRFYVVLLFWLTWMAILATAIAIIVKSPKPIAPPLKWWQKSLFYQLKPELLMEATMERSAGLNVLCDEFPYLKSLGVGALILEGLFGKDVSPVNFNTTAKGSATLPLIQYMLKEGNKTDLKVVLDFCDVDLLGSQDDGGDTDESSTLVKLKDALRFWLAQGVAGFTICDTDEVYSEMTLLEWRGVLKEFNTEDDRIVLVKQTRDTLPSLKNMNKTIVDVVIKSILPTSPHLLSDEEVASAIKTHLYRAEKDDIWNSWMIGGKASDKLKKLLVVLLMTLPGSPAVEQGSEIDRTEDKEKKRHLAVELFTLLSQSRAKEEALLYGSFTFLPSHTSTNSTLWPSPPVLAFLRSWGCVHFLVLLNAGAEPHALDVAWTNSLPEAGVFVASTGMDRLGTTSLETIELQPHEAIVIKLFEAGSYP